MDSRQRQDLDRHITGNYGEDQFQHPAWLTVHRQHCRWYESAAYCDYDSAADGPECAIIRIITSTHQRSEILLERVGTSLHRLIRKERIECFLIS